ncbi:MAG: xanthine dehydrogenase accessory protein XdhC [Roseovarius sp.]
MRDLDDLRTAVAREGAIARVVIAATRGSTPRAAGAAMLVWPGGQSGSIGGGRLEHGAAGTARALLAEGGGARVLRQALGSALGQCCGGAVVLVIERFNRQRVEEATQAMALSGAWARRIEAGASDPPRMARHGASAGIIWLDGWLIERLPPRHPVVIHGAGHVGRALADLLAPLPDLALTLADARTDLLWDLPACITPSDDPARALAQAPDEATHVIVTHDHALDLDLCHWLLQRRFTSAGLIGSATKWARFRQRLAALGHTDAQISRISCPIGDPDLGKHPQAIALGVAAALLKEPGIRAVDRRRTA